MKNSFWLGLFIGSIFPLLAFLLSRYTAWTSSFAPGKEGLLYMVAAGMNLLIIRLLYRRDSPLDRTAKGVVFITFIAMLAYVYTHKISI